jgi:hypothetical protein
MHMATDGALAIRPRQGRRSRPPVIAASLSGLQGPPSGPLELPSRLFWSAVDHTFDLSRRHDALAAYEAVLSEARTAADLAEFLHGGLLSRLWGDLHLPDRMREAWEHAHPALRDRAAHAAAA